MIYWIVVLGVSGLLIIGKLVGMMSDDTYPDDPTIHYLLSWVAALDCLLDRKTLR